MPKILFRVGLNILTINMDQIHCDFCDKKVWVSNETKLAIMFNDAALIEFESKIGFKHVNPSSRSDKSGRELFLACPYCIELYETSDSKI